jgi:signal transduction histidine kinase
MQTHYETKVKMQNLPGRNTKLKHLPWLWLCLLMLISQSILAQEEYEHELNTYNLIKTDSLWQYYILSDTSFSFSDSLQKNWQWADAKNLRYTSGTDISWPGAGWFRKFISLPDTLQGKSIAIMMGHFGASEIYVDGKLVKRYGTVGTTVAEEKTYIPRRPFLYETDGQSTHLITVHYSNQRAAKPNYVQIGFKGFQLALSPPEMAMREMKDSFPHSFVSLFVTLAFCIFFLLVYAFYPHRLASLFSAILLFNFCFIFVTGVIFSITNEGRLLIEALHLWQFAFACTFGWQVFFVYSVYYAKLPLRSWFIAGAMIIGVSMMLFQRIWPAVVFPLAILLHLEAWRIIILGIKKKKTGFWILAVAWLFQDAGVLIPIFDVFHLFPPYFTNTRLTLALATDLSAPLILALHLAWEFGTANRDLKRQLKQVNELSKKNLEQEQEKKQLLAMQNETLEQQVTERTAEVLAQKEKIERQRDDLSHTLDELKLAQAQLIQSEKMASLGELTAGIAHEIQNPLNFVNNFSELNSELIAEMKQEMGKGNYEDVKLIANNIDDNEQKINFHGKRADAIVKGMLQHSRSSSGVKEPTDINALADEYLRLAYHGLRAKDKSFNATMKTDFDETIGNINIIPQDIGRVILNLITNAFYAVTEKKKQIGGGYEPTVSVSTKKVNDKIEIRVADNGNGIPQKVLDKIFQPFFTTKPTGEGTGLGLSLSYDIIRKGHGGDLKVKNKEGEGAEFVIILPHQL